MVWKIKYADSALKSLKKMDRQNAKRIVDYRVLCEILDEELIILAATIGHSREVYE